MSLTLLWEKFWCRDWL